jgi:hypothetical protein
VRIITAAADTGSANAERPFFQAAKREGETNTRSGERQ